MKIAIWVAQVILGLFFIYVGIMHFIVPEGLPDMMSWMYELSTPLHVISGTAEILGGLGVLLPAIARIQTRLIPLAAAGLALVMILAVGYHITRGEMQNVASNVVWILVAAFVAYGRWKIAPLTDRNAEVVA